ncbi:MAG: glycosyltransferase [Smithella sp.]
MRGEKEKIWESGDRPCLYMNKPKQLYHGQDVAFIIPTKDRPGKIKNLLSSIASQTELCGRIIIVDGGCSIENIVTQFACRLPVEYYECKPPGQIRQKNMGISVLDERTPLVCFLDDDIVLEKEAIQSMLTCWNSREPETAGISFNIVNNPPYRYSLPLSLLGMSSRHQGRVLRSGYNTRTSPVVGDLRTEWLPGGATVWKQEILLKFRQKEIHSRWAICEDLIFSYPIGKNHPLYVCSDAKVRHEHVFDHKAEMKYLYYGRTVTLWRLYFVELHPEMSRLLFLWMILGQITLRSVWGLISFQFNHIQYALGQVEGIITGLSAVLRKRDISTVLDEKNITSS